MHITNILNQKNEPFHVVERMFKITRKNQPHEKDHNLYGNYSGWLSINCTGNIKFQFKCFS